jgi:RNA polymerase sigma-70 factor (ECF subfamily)
LNRTADAAETREASPAFEVVYERHFDDVYRFVARLSGTSQCEDLVQEVFVVVHKRLPEFEGRAKLTTWLFQIAYRVVGAHVRKERVLRLLRRAFSREPREEAAPPSAPARIEEQERARAVNEALASLSWKKRVVVSLHEIDGWTCERIAEALSVPVGTVYTRLHHARKELAIALAQMRPHAGGQS